MRSRWGSVIGLTYYSTSAAVVPSQIFGYAVGHESGAETGEPVPKLPASSRLTYHEGITCEIVTTYRARPTRSWNARRIRHLGSTTTILESPIMSAKQPVA